MAIYISLYSNNLESLKDFIQVLNKINQELFAKTQNITIKQYTQKNSKLITVLKSPHVNKKAQEHFSLFQYKKIIKINSYKINKIFILLKRLQIEIFSDIFLKIKIKLNCLKLKKNKINPDIFMIDFSKNLIALNKVTYIKILEKYGEILFNKRFAYYKNKKFR